MEEELELDYTGDDLDYYPFTSIIDQPLTTLAVKPSVTTHPAPREEKAGDGLFVGDDTAVEEDVHGSQIGGDDDPEWQDNGDTVLPQRAAAWPWAEEDEGAMDLTRDEREYTPEALDAVTCFPATLGGAEALAAVRPAEHLQQLDPRHFGIAEASKQAPLKQNGPELDAPLAQRVYARLPTAPRQPSAPRPPALASRIGMRQEEPASDGPSVAYDHLPAPLPAGLSFSRNKRRRAADVEEEEGPAEQLEPTSYELDRRPCEYKDLRPELEEIPPPGPRVQKRRRVDPPPATGFYNTVQDDTINNLVRGERLVHDQDFTHALPAEPQSDEDDEARQRRKFRRRGRSRSHSRSRGRRSASVVSSIKEKGDVWVTVRDEFGNEHERIDTEAEDSEEVELAEDEESRHSLSLGIAPTPVDGQPPVIGQRNRFALRLLEVDNDDLLANDKIPLLHATRFRKFRVAVMLRDGLKSSTVRNHQPFAVSVGRQHGSNFHFAQLLQEDAAEFESLLKTLIPKSLLNLSLCRLEGEYFSLVFVISCKKDMREEDVELIQKLISKGAVTEDHYEEFIPYELRNGLRKAPWHSPPIFFHPVTNKLSGRSCWKLPPLKPPTVFLVRMTDYLPPAYEITIDLLMDQLKEIEDDENETLVWDEEGKNLLLMEIDLSAISKQLQGTSGLWLLAGYTPTPRQVTGNHTFTLYPPEDDDEFELDSDAELEIKFEIHLVEDDCDVLGCDLPFSHPTHLHDQFHRNGRKLYLEKFA